MRQAVSVDVRDGGGEKERTVRIGDVLFLKKRIVVPRPLLVTDFCCAETCSSEPMHIANVRVLTPQMHEVLLPAALLEYDDSAVVRFAELLAFRHALDSQNMRRLAEREDDTSDGLDAQA